MGASIYVYWPGSTEDEQGSHPGFQNDDKAYADWITAILGDKKLVSLLRDSGFAPLLSVHALDTPDSEVEWTTPADLRTAANKLRDALVAASPSAERLVAIYQGPGIEPPNMELAQDLADVAALADYATQCGTDRMTLTIGW